MHTTVYAYLGSGARVPVLSMQSQANAEQWLADNVSRLSAWDDELLEFGDAWIRPARVVALACEVRGSIR